MLGYRQILNYISGLHLTISKINKLFVAVLSAKLTKIYKLSTSADEWKKNEILLTFMAMEDECFAFLCLFPNLPFTLGHLFGKKSHYTRVNYIDKLSTCGLRF